MKTETDAAQCARSVTVLSFCELSLESVERIEFCALVPSVLTASEKVNPLWALVSVVLYLAWFVWGETSLLDKCYSCMWHSSVVRWLDDCRQENDLRRPRWQALSSCNTLWMVTEGVWHPSYWAVGMYSILVLERVSYSCMWECIWIVRP